MDIILHIRELMDARGWSIYQLARHSDLPQSTLSNLFNRHNLPTIPTLERICDALGVTLAEFFGEETVDDMETRRELLRRVEELTPAQRKALLDFLRQVK